MRLNLKAKMIVFSLLVSMGSIVLAGFLINYSLDRRFRAYLKENTEREDRQIVDILSSAYKSRGGWGGLRPLEMSMAMMGMMEGKTVRVLDASGREIFDTGEAFQGMMGSRMMGQGQQSPGYGGYSNWQTMHEECEEMMERMMGQWQETAKALTSEDAVSIAQNYLRQTKNPNLTVGTVETREDGDYLVEIVTKDGSLVDKLEINHFTGWFHSIYARE